MNMKRIVYILILSMALLALVNGENIKKLTDEAYLKNRTANSCLN